MALVRKFTFDNDFDRPKPAVTVEPVVEVEAPPPPPSFSEEEVAAAVAEARKAALAEGMAKGRADTAAQTEKQTATALNAIATHLAAIERDVLANATKVTEITVELSLAMTRRLFPELARRHGLEEVEGLLARCLDMLKTEPRFTVRVTAAQREDLLQQIDTLAGQRGFEGRVLVVGDETLKPGDCRIEWAQGGMIRSADEIWSGIGAAMEQALATADAVRPAGADAVEPAAVYAGEPAAGNAGAPAAK